MCAPGALSEGKRRQQDGGRVLGRDAQPGPEAEERVLARAGAGRDAPERHRGREHEETHPHLGPGVLRPGDMLEVQRHHRRGGDRGNAAEERAGEVPGERDRAEIGRAGEGPPDEDDRRGIQVIEHAEVGGAGEGAAHASPGVTERLLQECEIEDQRGPAEIVRVEGRAAVAAPVPELPGARDGLFPRRAREDPSGTPTAGSPARRRERGRGRANRGGAWGTELSGRRGVRKN